MSEGNKSLYERLTATIRSTRSQTTSCLDFRAIPSSALRPIAAEKREAGEAAPRRLPGSCAGGPVYYGGGTWRFAPGMRISEATGARSRSRGRRWRFGFPAGSARWSRSSSRRTTS